MKEEKMNKKSSANIKEVEKKKGESIYNQLPTEFKTMLEEVASGESPFQLIDYLDIHKTDYISPNSPVKEEHFLLMVQETFGSPVTPHLYEYSDKLWDLYKVQIDSIFYHVELILEKYKSMGTIQSHRNGAIFNTDPVASLVQNMWVFLYQYYRHFHMEQKKELAKKEILLASENNIYYVLNLENAVARKIIEEERKSNISDVGYTFGTCFHFSEPIIALVKECPFEEDTVEIYEKYFDYLGKIGPCVKSGFVFDDVIMDAKDQLEELYDNRLGDIQDQIEMTEDELIGLCKKRNKLRKKIRKLREKNQSRFEYWDDRLPF